MAVPDVAPPPALLLLLSITASLCTAVVRGQVMGVGGASWCVARSDASSQALQTALDYACGSGADCHPIQSDGLCFLPNTIQAHASYAFNSYYQRKTRAPGSCDFAGTATIAQTDPSYGSCVYPTSSSTAGGTNIPITTPPLINPNVPTPTTTSPFFGGGAAGGGINPGMTSPVPDNSRATLATANASLVLSSLFLLLTYLLILA
ncbi:PLASMODESMATA CALLOSE-BINDING PROTEIN 3-like [Prosopis cineraria]|uniref:PLASMODESMATA CALLOSE-BINDING PROTEIN 3-like n=1 Tax=Prosopis cineraria TaxID=364024 RepID=UPI00240F1FB9|nr:PLASMODESMATA CALLOSE-BINDING PROTEIN 3-like [Prosopis cineraria]